MSKSMIKLVNKVLYSSEEMTNLTMWWVSQNISVVEREYKNKLEKIEKRLKRLEQKQEEKDNE